MDSTCTDRIHGLRSLVGNTPMMELAYELDGRPGRVFAKAEHLNMTGSIKDRMAFHILEQGYARGALHAGDRLVEATSGNTGIAFAALGRALGHPVTIFMPDWMSSERINLIASLGAEIVLVSRADGGFLGSIRRAEELVAGLAHGFLPRQFSNEDNVAAHEATTGPEILWQLRARGLRPDAFVAGVGTGGTIMGVGRLLRAHCPDVRLHPLEPANSPTLSTGHKVGQHRIQGISDEFIPAIVHLSDLDPVLAVDDGDAILMAQKLAAQAGLGVGISSGANFLGAVQLAAELGDDAVVVTVFPDSNKKYLSTDLLRREPVKPDHVAPRITLTGVSAFRRVCHTCAEPGDRRDAQASARPQARPPRAAGHTA